MILLTLQAKHLLVSNESIGLRNQQFVGVAEEDEPAEGGTARQEAE